MIDLKLGHTQETQELIERMCRYVERSNFVLDKSKAEELILQTYDLFNLPRPKHVVWHLDIFDPEYQIALESSAWSASSARSAWSAWSAWSASSTRSAWSAWSARSTSSAWSAWSARSASSARSARSAWSASSASSALDCDFDWFVVINEYMLNPGAKQPNDNDLKYLEYCDLLIRAIEAGLGYRVESGDTLHLVPTPLVRLDSQNNYHSDDQPALYWKDGSEFFYLHGVSFDEKLWKQVTSRRMSFQDILSIVDVDQRKQAMKYGNVFDFVKFGKAEELDTYTKISAKDGRKIRYWLYRFPKNDDLFPNGATYAVYEDSMLGPAEIHMQGIAPEINAQTVPEAMAWKQIITPQEWEALELDIDFT